MPAQRLQINLMNEYVRQVKKRKLLFTKVQFYAAGVLIVYVACLIVVLGYRGILTLQLSSLQQTIDSETRKITQLRLLEDRYLILQNKLSLIQDYWGEMPDVRAYLYSLLPIMPENVSINTLAYIHATNTIEMESETTDVFAAFSWLNVLEEQAKMPEYAKIGVNDLVRSDDGTYTITLTIYLGES